MVFRKTATKNLALFEDIAFEQIDSLYSTALRLTRNRQNADDLVRDTFRQAYRHFHNFELGADFKKWIFEILLNSYFDKFHDKSATAAAVQLSRFEQTIDRAVQQKDLKHWLIDSDTLPTLFDDQIMCAIETMPADYRIAILLCDIENFSYPEIGELLHISTTEVGMRIYAGRKILQQSLLDFVTQKFASEGKLES